MGSIQMQNGSSTNSLASKAGRDVEDPLPLQGAAAHEEAQETLLGHSSQAKEHEQRLKKEYSARDRDPHRHAATPNWCLKLGLASITGLLLVVVIAVGVLHGVEEEQERDRAAAAYEHLKSRVPDGFPIHLPKGAGEPIKRAPKPIHAKGVIYPVLHPNINYSSLLQPEYHIGPSKGWINDPNGMFQAPDGRTHVFFQLNPDAPVWGAPWWGHVVSEDMAHWKWLPPALKPDQWYDTDGVFSGSATLLPNGSVIMLYTGVINSAQYGFLYQLQAAAVPSDPSDPDLVEWTKLRTNPTSIQIPPGGTHAQFRDPITAWALTASDLAPSLEEWGIPLPCAHADDEGSNSTDASSEDDCDDALVYMTAVGTMDNCLGGASLYVSTDELRSWTYVGSLYSQLAQNYSRYAVCLPPVDQRDKGDDIPPGSKGYGGHCDQFGRECRMWECPDFFDTNVEGVQAFKYSDQARERPQFAQDFYVLGESRYTNYSLAGLQDGKDAYSGMLNNHVYQPAPLDYGVVYASKSFEAADKRRLWLGWVFEDSLGCTELCADGTPFIRNILNWQGAQTLMREVTYKPDTQTLRFYPIQEMRNLRVGPPLYDDYFLLHTRDGENETASQLLLPEEPAYETFKMEAHMLSEQPEGGSKSNSISPVLSPSMPAAGRGSPGGRRQVELQLNFTLQAEAGALSVQQMEELHPFEFAVDILTGNGTFTHIKVNGTASAPGARANHNCSSLRPMPHLLGGEQWSCVHAADVWVEREHSGGMTKPGAQGGPIKLPQQGVKATDLSLAVWVDRSVLEVFAFDGSAVVTSRIYPLPYVEHKQAEHALEQAEQGQQPVSGQSSSQVASKKGMKPVGTIELGAWGYQVAAKWGPGHVKVKAEAHEVGSCWVG